MKKVISYLLIMAFHLLTPKAFADTTDYNHKKDVFNMPASVEIIETEAFAGTAVKTVFFQAGFLSIGDSAFADSRFLTDAYIPSTTKHIGENAFPSNKKLTIKQTKTTIGTFTIYK